MLDTIFVVVPLIANISNDMTTDLLQHLIAWNRKWKNILPLKKRHDLEKKRNLVWMNIIMFTFF